ncbi:acetyltransferase [Stutzerimonas kunmingensis]|uniref:acetyltransferase n=1 Tax=Stutzerimonas kunmingensis TaxID=1211807 RepID=UPI0028B086CF|nr:acetyltransferase [Stutzerimonas kunmingensis]
MKRLALLGASGHGKVIADTAECCGWQEIEFFDDAWPARQTNGYWPVVGDTTVLLSSLGRFDGVLVAIGNNRIRQAKLLQLQAIGAHVVSLIHPSATFSRYARLGVGSVVFAGAVINADTQIGQGTILNTGCSVDHDCVLGNAVHISPGARLAGGVEIGDLSWVGIGASVRQLILIGSGVMVGAGAAVVADVADGQTVVGVPACSLR